MIVERPCPTCGRPTGDHLVREWTACFGTPWEDLAYEDTPQPVPPFTLDGRDVIVADTITARAMVGADPEGRIQIPTLLLTFAVGRPGAPPDTVAEVAFIATPATLRKAGVLIRDAANGAANRAEGR